MRQLSRLFWVLLLVLSGIALTLRLRAPSHRALPWFTAALLLLLAVQLIAMAWDWRMGRLPGTRLLLPAVVLAEGLGLLSNDSSQRAFQLRLGAALGLEILLLALAIQALARARRRPGDWPEDRISSAFETLVPPRAARLLALELVLLGSAVRFILGGFSQPGPPGFSHHRESPLGTLLPVLPLLIPADLLLVHAVFPQMAPWLRWILQGSTLYGVLWLMGFYATLKARPHQIRDGRVNLHLGLVKRVSFPASCVRSAAPLPSFDDDWTRHAHLKGTEQLVAKGNTVLDLTLGEPVRVLGLMGLGRSTQRIAVSADDPSAFLAALSPRSIPALPE